MKCQICNSEAKLFGHIPFDTNNNAIPIVDTAPITYFKCNKCGCIFCPEMMDWSKETLREKVYNSNYIKYDPDYLGGNRAEDYGNFLKKLLPTYQGSHLDYGSGSGLLGKKLGWNTYNYDPFSQNSRPVSKYLIITMIEVVEHSQNINLTIADALSFIDRRGVLIFSTLLADKNTTIDWPYIAPRNGHINIQSRESLKIIAKKLNMFCDSIAENVHVLQSTRNNFKDIQRGMIWY